ncbi:MAG: substrate-binding domain-containing protein [Oscillospiraceae bacterium]|nr:substrate-binding domain-containing protein [Oscillospiraceae bacterium]
MRRRIAVITARADDSEQRALLDGIARTAFSFDADVVVFSNVYNHWSLDTLLNFENIIYDFFQPEQFDGVIVTAESFFDQKQIEPLLERARRCGTPAVIIGGTAEGFSSIRSDDMADLEEIAAHLITVHGLTDIDILTGPRHIPVSDVRVEGCRRAFERYGIPFRPEHVHYGNFWNDSGEQLAARYLSGDLPMPQAVICTNDYMAYGLCDVLTSAGVPIPDRISVTGYDHGDGRIFHHPTLTTFRRGRTQMGMRAAALVLGEVCPAVPKENRLICGNTCRCGINSAQLNAEILHARIGQYHTAMISVAQFSARLTTCRSLAEYTAVLQDFFYLLHGAAALHLCLDKGWNTPAYDGETFLCSRIRPHEVSGVPVSCCRPHLIPALLEERDAPALYCVTPLCFQTRLMGCAVLVYDTPQCYDFSFREWNKTVANTLEFLRMKNDIHYLKQCQRVSTLYDALTGFYHRNEFLTILQTSSRSRSAGSLHAVRLCVPADAEYRFGENLRSDVLSAAASAVKQAFGPHAIFCRAEEDVLLILDRSGTQGEEKLSVMLHHALCGRFDESQVQCVCASWDGPPDERAADALCEETAQRAASAASDQTQRAAHPHYRTMLTLRSRIYEQPKKAPATEEICKTLCMSDGYFRVTYKKCLGESYIQDCIHARTMLACYLLCTTAMSIFAIARHCGYNDEKYFARQFHKAKGCAPARYREQYC